ncbi:MAG TPA: flavodoxin family protein [Xanthobacteraceae bacterium]|jgi:multimeric flavodoxin WrbA
MFDWLKSDAASKPRTGMPSPRLAEADFKRRFRNQFQDHAFDGLTAELERLTESAWDAYANSRKSPRTRKAGTGFSDPDYDLALDWIAATEAIKSAARQHADPSGSNRILLINASPRSEHTCPGEMSKSFRLTQIAQEVFSAGGAAVDLLDLSRIASEYGRAIHPCKACFSTSPALCHWPCSCYPNYSLGQTHDWMNEIYPLWVAAHGIMIITPVHWYQTASPLKLMMDRLVCADGGNSDPTTTHGKNAEDAKRLELDGWNYPKHLAGRLFGIVTHGDTEGAENVRRALADWLSNMHLESAGHTAEIDRYIGYWKPYATSHAELDTDDALQNEVRLVAQTLLDAVAAKRSNRPLTSSPHFNEPRQK